MKLLGYIQLATEVIALIASVVFYYPLRTRKWLPWIPFLLYTCVTEITGTYLAETDKTYNNLWLYNPYIILSIAFYGWFLIRISVYNKTATSWLQMLLLLFIIGNAVWYVLYGNPKKLISFTLNAGAFIICLLCILFFFTHIKNKSPYNSLVNIPGFWIVTGLLIFYAGISLYVTIYDLLAASNIRILNVTIQNLIPQVLSLVLYTAITYDLYQCKYQLSTY